MRLSSKRLYTEASIPLLTILRAVGRSCGFRKLSQHPPKIRLVKLESPFIGFYFSEEKRIDLSLEVGLQRKPPEGFNNHSGVYGLAVLTHELLHHLLVNYEDLSNGDRETAHGPKFQEIAQIVGFRRPFGTIVITQNLAKNLELIYDVTVDKIKKSNSNP